MKNYLIEIPFIRKNFKKTKASKFKGILKIVSNQYGIIYDWKIEFDELYVDTMTTKSWFIKKTLNFERRKKIFEKINICQEQRINKTNHKIEKLNQKQIEKVNEFFNDRNQYNSTIKNIIGILKGNNPCGEAKKPSSAELVIDLNLKAKNFVILIDDLMMKKEERTCFNIAMINSQKIELDEFIKLNPTIESAFNFMQKEKNGNDFSEYLKNIKAYYKEYNNYLVKAGKIIKKERSKYSKNIDKNIEKFPFNFKNKDQFQKCHIYEVHKIKQKITALLKENKSFKKYQDMVSDYENFLPLRGEDHRKFDAKYFTYQINGKILPINEKGNQYIEENMNGYEKIDDFFLTNKRKKYLNLRNDKKKF